MNKNDVKKIWLDDEAIHILTKDGKTASEKFADYRRLREATKKQRNSYQINALGVYWPEIDEDLSFDGFFKHQDNDVADIIKKNPIINVSALARRMHISQPLFAAYVSGIKKPSVLRIKKIKEEIRKIGHELTTTK